MAKGIGPIALADRTRRAVTLLAHIPAERVQHSHAGVTVQQLAEATGLTISRVRTGLTYLVRSGEVVVFTGTKEFDDSSNATRHVLRYYLAGGQRRG